MLAGASELCCKYSRLLTPDFARMDYKITHTTVYTYSETVSICHNEVHLTPREGKRQARLAYRLAIRPQPLAIDNEVDYFGNQASYFTIEEGHEKLTVTAQSRVRVLPPPPLEPDGASWESVRDRLAVDHRTASLEARQFAFDSPSIAASADLAAYAEGSFLPGRPWLDAAQDLTRRIFAEFKYEKMITTIHTPLRVVLAERRGVCQDFAQLAIGCLRSIGLPARYMSGYLVTEPPPGKPRLVGADASHAWFSAYSPEHGWIDFDPTNGLIPSDKHITLAWGRDYNDVAPIKGVFIGGGRHGMNVAVDVTPLPGDDRAPSAEAKVAE